MDPQMIVELNEYIAQIREEEGWDTNQLGECDGGTIPINVAMPLRRMAQITEKVEQLQQGE